MLGRLCERVVRSVRRREDGGGGRIVEERRRTAGGFGRKGRRRVLVGDDAGRDCKLSCELRRVSVKGEVGGGEGSRTRSVDSSLFVELFFESFVMVEDMVVGDSRGSSVRWGEEGRSENVSE